MKKTGKLVCVFLISLLCIGKISFAEFIGTAEINPTEIEVKKGEEFSIVVNLTCKTIDGESLVTTTAITYNTDILEYVEVKSNEDRKVEGSVFEDTGYVFTDGEMKNGETVQLFTIVFKVLDVENLPETTTLEISDFTATDGGTEVIMTNLGKHTINLKILKEENSGGDNKEDNEGDNKENKDNNQEAKPEKNEKNSSEINTNQNNNNEIVVNETETESEEIPLTGANHSPITLIIPLLILTSMAITIIILKNKEGFLF